MMRKQLKPLTVIGQRLFSRLLSGLFILISLIPLDAMAVLTLNPTRIIFEDRTRSETVTIINQNNHPTTYRISFTNKRMLPDGGIIDIVEPVPGEQFADAMIRYSPRQITIEPGKSQTVRLLLRKPRDLAEGEYRSHMVVREVSNPTIGSNIENINLKDAEMSISLIARMGISIPVIVRHGLLNATSILEDLTYQAGNDTTPPSLSFSILRHGSQSLYGNISIIHVAANGDERQVGAAKGVAVYTPNASRTITIPLNLARSAGLQNGKLKVIYRPNPNSKPRKSGKQILAEASISLP